MKHTEKNPRNLIEGFQIYIYIYIYIYVHKFGAISRQGLEIFYLVRFHIFEPYQSSKNKIKQLKTNEEQWKIMKNSENQWKKYEKYNKNNETYGQKSTQWKASKYIIWSHVTPGSRKYSILSVFVFLSLIKAQKKH